MTRRAGVIQITGNSQNSDKDIMDIFVAPDGYSIVQVDQAGAEALIVAYLAAAGKYRELFTEGVKPHIYVALHLFLDKFRGDQPIERYWLQRPAVLRALPEWSELSKTIANSKFEYDIGKRTSHAKNYSMGPNTFRENVLRESEGSLVLSIEQARFFLDTYANLFPEIIAWQHEIRERIERDRQLRNLFGYPRAFEQNFTDGYMREAISWIPQSTVGCITHTAYNLLTKKIRAERLPWRPFNNKHDSYAAMVPDDHVPEAALTMTTYINQRFTGWDGCEFQMKSEVQVGKNMKKRGKAKDGVYPNPLGLRDYAL